jgi:ABC-type branched-subunit amino acid transport system ATPase component
VTRLQERIERIVQGGPTLPLVVLFGLNAVDELDRTAFSVLTPEIKDAFDLSNQGILGLVSAFGVVVLFLSLPIAHFADRRNRIRMARGGAIAWAAFSFLTGLAPTIAVLMLARLGSGLGKAVNDPTHNSLIADYYPPETRGGVYYAHRLASTVGQLSAPLIAGVLATLFTWRTPFFVFAFPTVFFVVLAARLHEPIRGAWERLAGGADAEAAKVEEAPLPFRAAMRELWKVRSLRRTWFALPFLTASLLGFGALMNLFWEDVYGLSSAERGVLESVSEGFQLAGILGAGVLVQRIVARNPADVVRLLAGAGVIASALIAGIALSPVLLGSIVFRIGLAAMLVALIPGIYTVASMVIPPRCRSLGFSAAAIFAVPGVLFLPIAGGIGDAAGLRAGMMSMIPVYLVGSAILMTAAKHVPADIARLRSAQVAHTGPSGAPCLLEVRGVDASYGQTQVLFDVDLRVEANEIVALLGTNGAGKSTVLRAISGLLPKDRGSVLFDGDDITSLDPNTITRAGIAQVPGGRGVFPSLTVAENLRAAGWLFRGDKARVKAATARALELFPELEKRWDTTAGSLSGGEQQMLSLSQAFIAKPKLLMIDELSLGLAPTIVERLLEIVREIHAQGTTVILVEQSVTTALRLASRAVFMEKGEVRFEGPTADLLDRPDILRAVYLKGSAAAVTKKRTKKAVRDERALLLQREAVLEVSGLTKRYGGVTAVDDVAFDLHQGEVLGLVGPNGAGKTTIFDLISGFQPMDGGRVRLFGQDVTEWPAFARARAGLGRMFQDARLWPSLTVREAIATALERHVETGDPLSAMLGLPSTAASERATAERVEELIELVHVGAFGDKFVGELSTGSRRMVEIACLLGIEPRILLLDEPSSGIAQKEAEALGPILKDVQTQLGASILIIEHSMPLLTSIADHLLALDRGRVVTWGDPDTVLTHPQVVESYLGGELV